MKRLERVIAGLVRRDGSQVKWIANYASSARTTAHETWTAMPWERSEVALPT